MASSSNVFSLEVTPDAGTSPAGSETSSQAVPVKRGRGRPNGKTLLSSI